MEDPSRFFVSFLFAPTILIENRKWSILFPRGGGGLVVPWLTGFQNLFAPVISQSYSPEKRWNPAGKRFCGSPLHCGSPPSTLGVLGFWICGLSSFLFFYCLPIFRPQLMNWIRNDLRWIWRWVPDQRSDNFRFDLGKKGIFRSTVAIFEKCTIPCETKVIHRECSNGEVIISLHKKPDNLGK